MNEPATSYRVPQQKRSKESLERLLDAAEEQIRAEGIGSLTIANVVGRAGLSVGAFMPASLIETPYFTRCRAASTTESSRSSSNDWLSRSGPRRASRPPSNGRSTCWWNT